MIDARLYRPKANAPIKTAKPAPTRVTNPFADKSLAESPRVILLPWPEEDEVEVGVEELSEASVTGSVDALSEVAE
jgi:hypothetical protein